MTTAKRARETRGIGNGRFIHTVDAMCVCGHSLGDHTAESVGGMRPCIIGDFGDCDCDCEAFKKVRAPKKREPNT
jgi:hypothetical protein